LGGRVEASPGDLDEAIAAFIDADRNQDNPNDTFARVDAFRQGVLNGYLSCANYADASPAPSG
jgi:hypothetical protein